MDAISYLKQAREIEIKIQQKEQEIASLKKDAIGSSGRKMEKLVVAYTDLEDELQRDILKLHQKRNVIINTIHQTEDSLCMVVLHAKWIDGNSLEQVAAQLGYSFPYIRRKYWKGMRKMKEVLSKKKQF